jgi:hypothetical protein
LGDADISIDGFDRYFVTSTGTGRSNDAGLGIFGRTGVLV